jgi:hypothetical protein
VDANVVMEQLDEFRLARVLTFATLGQQCFDCDAYKVLNPDLAGFDCDGAFQHFVNSGLIEGRPAKMKCNIPPLSLFPFFPMLNQDNQLPRLPEDEVVKLMAA